MALPSFFKFQIELYKCAGLLKYCFMKIKEMQGVVSNKMNPFSMLF